MTGGRGRANALTIWLPHPPLSGLRGGAGAESGTAPQGAHFGSHFGCLWELILGVILSPLGMGSGLISGGGTREVDLVGLDSDVCALRVGICACVCFSLFSFTLWLSRAR